MKYTESKAVKWPTAAGELETGNERLTIKGIGEAAKDGRMTADKQ